MRTHGVPNFPDPSSTGNQGLQVRITPSSATVNGVTVNAPAFKTAMQACQADLPNGGKGGPVSLSQRRQALAFSACMRAHGVTNFPDPTFTGGGIRIALNSNSGIDPNSPVFKAAQAACGSLGPKGSAGGAAASRSG
jgi:hypothetical protein